MKVGDLVRIKDMGFDDHDVPSICGEIGVIVQSHASNLGDLHDHWYIQLSEPYNIQCVSYADLEVLSEAC